MFVFRTPTQTEPTIDDLRQILGAKETGARVFATVTSFYPSHQPPSPTAFAKFVRNLTTQTEIQDVVVMNEPNLNKFWGGKPNPRAYMRLLSITHAFNPNIRLWAFALHRQDHVKEFIQAAGRAHKGKLPFYGVAHHPYHINLPTPILYKHKGGVYTIGDTDRLLKLYDQAFPEGKRKFPIILSETGYPTVHTTESLWAQAYIMRTVYNYLACKPRVEAIMTFEFRDSPLWQTGVFLEDGTPKPSLNVLKEGATCNDIRT